MIESLSRYWALAGGAALTAGVAVFVLWRLYTNSARGRLRAAVRRLRGRYAGLVAADRRVRRAQGKVGQLEKRREAVRPRRLDEAKEALVDARALLKIAQDQVLVAENHVRRLIVEEFPPRRQETLRDRYLSRPVVDGKPFTF